MRTGSYAAYKGKEYYLSKKEEGFFNLVSEIFEDEKTGFKQNPYGLYTKKISFGDIEHAYHINTFCSYKGHRFEIWREEAGKLIVDTMDRALLASLNLVERERGVYEARVTPDELDSIWEEREPVYDLPFLTDPIKIIK